MSGPPSMIRSGFTLKLVAGGLKRLFGKLAQSLAVHLIMLGQIRAYEARGIAVNEIPAALLRTQSWVGAGTSNCECLDSFVPLSHMLNTDDCGPQIKLTECISLAPHGILWTFHIRTPGY